MDLNPYNAKVYIVHELHNLKNQNEYLLILYTQGDMGNHN